MGNSSARRKIMEAIEAGWESLDLSDNLLTVLPPEIGQLDQLQRLFLSDNLLTGLPTEITQLVQLQTLNLSDNLLTELPPEIAHLDQLQDLDLRDNQLTKLPPEIGQLAQLQTLGLSDNQLTELPPEVAHLNQLQDLNLCDNQLTELPPEIGQLDQLRRLFLTSNQLTVLPLEVGQLAKLRSLGLGDNRLTELPLEVAHLDQLQNLYLSENLLTELPPEIAHLDQLQGLNIENNRLTEVPPKIAYLDQLQRLFLGSNQLTVLPPEIGQLAQLETLDLSRNRLTELPSEIAHLDQLQRLFLSSNRLTVLPPEIGQLAQLQTLGLGDNQLAVLPSEIAHLAQLQTLDLSSNQLAELPPKIAQLQNLQRLFLHSNEALNIPPEILGPTRQEVFGGKVVTTVDPAEILVYYFRLKDEEPRPLHEAKILIVGEGAVGKTSLVNRIVFDRHNPDEPKTDGIAILDWQIETHKSPEGETLDLHIWDFGGQEIMHATHQFFLTRRSLYLLVVEARKGDDGTQLVHWLRIIQSFGGDSPVLVVINKTEGSNTPDLDETRLRIDHPNIRGFYPTSCREPPAGFGPLKAAIIRELESLDHVYSPLPATYFEVKKQLEGLTEDADFVDVDQYQRLAAEQGIKEAGEQKRLLRFLHDLGSVLHFDDPEGLFRLDETKILNPEWVTSGVYKILNDLELMQNQGVLKRRDLDRILTTRDGYPKKARLFILGMMRRFELCFDFREGDVSVLIPQLLPRSEPEILWPDNDCLEFEVHYSYLPPGLLPRFIVKSRDHLTERSTYWRSGVLLEIGDNHVLVRGDASQGHLYIAVSGGRRGRRAALATVRNILRGIHQTIPGIEVQENVPLPNDPGLTVDYEHLLLLEKEGETSCWPPGAKGKYSVQQLLDGVEARKDRARNQSNTIINYGRVDMSKKEYHNRGIAFQGDGQKFRDVSIQQVYQEDTELNLEALQDELAQLRQALLAKATEPEDYREIASLAAAEKTAAQGDQAGTWKHLKNLGRLSLDTARQIGIELTAALLASGLGT